MQYKNSKGADYYLNSRMTTLKNGREQRFYFFSLTLNRDTYLAKMPPGMEVSETKNGLPVLRKKQLVAA